jgi:hypothetical protein
MNGPKRKPDERERDLEALARLYVKGTSQSEIAAKLHVTQQQISYDLKELRKRWAASTLRVRDEELAKIDAIEAEYWAAWEKSKDLLIVETKTKAKGVLPGDPRFLQGALSCVERRCKILGFDKVETHHDRVTAEAFIEALRLLGGLGGDSAIASVLHEPAGDGPGARPPRLHS